jgi:hypothetical protein
VQDVLKIKEMAEDKEEVNLETRVTLIHYAEVLVRTKLGRRIEGKGQP